LVEKESRSVGDVPIGGVVAWLSNIAGVPNLPEGWALCDGSTISDGNSPLNGQTIPDLNGDNRFLRGNSTSGGTGGSENHQHTESFGVAVSTIVSFAEDPFGGSNDTITEARSTSDNVSSGTFTGSLTSEARNSSGNAVSPLPTYYAVVWIIRIK
tara:strand:- start:1718 stop:2182 length:465 start_codon:yes stop_codon:yes gene_type:complete